MIAYRLTQTRYATTAFRGDGGLYRAGRWHPKGLRIVYTAESPALALAELLCHVDRSSLLVMDLSLPPCRFADDLIEHLDVTRLPPGWHGFPWIKATQEAGRRWLDEKRSLVLAVPSAVVPRSTNYLINPSHPRFDEIQIEASEPFVVDERLAR